jgi:hypothetical protein
MAEGNEDNPRAIPKKEALNANTPPFDIDTIHAVAMEMVSAIQGECCLLDYSRTKPES